MEVELFQDGGQIKNKRSITTMGVKIQAFDIFQTPLSSHYPLPLSTTLAFRCDLFCKGRGKDSLLLAVNMIKTAVCTLDSPMYCITVPYVMNFILKFRWTGLAHKHSSMMGHTVGKNKAFLKLEKKTNRMIKYLLYEIMI